MTEERMHAILFAATLLCARKLIATIESDKPNLAKQYFADKAIQEAEFVLENLKFVVLMDSMDEQLKDLISYINQKSQLDIYGVELEYYKHDEYEIVIPKMHGVGVKKDFPSAGNGPATFKGKPIQAEDFVQVEFDTDLKMWVKVLEVKHVSIKGKILEKGRDRYPQGREMFISIEYVRDHRPASNPPKLNK